MDRTDYDENMESLLNDRDTYQLAHKSPFAKIKAELNSRRLNLKKQNKIDGSTYRKLHSTDASPTAICGSPKHLKPSFLLRPIVFSIGSAFYNISKFLTDILAPIQSRNGYSVLNSSQFAKKEVADMEILDDEVMVSFDVVSLFTTIPVKKACEYIHNKFNDDNSLNSRTNLTADVITSLLELILSNNYFA